MFVRTLLCALLVFVFHINLSSQEDMDREWSVGISGLFGQTSGPNFSASGAGIAVNRQLSLTQKSMLRLHLMGADLRGASYLVTDIQGNTIGKGRQAFLKSQFNTLYQQRFLTLDDAAIYVALGPGISYIYENTFEEINNEEFEGPDYRVFAFNALFEIGVELPQFIFSTSLSQSIYNDDSPVLDANNLYIALSAGYRL